MDACWRVMFGALRRFASDICSSLEGLQPATPATGAAAGAPPSAVPEGYCGLRPFRAKVGPSLDFGWQLAGSLSSTSDVEERGYKGS